MSQDIFNANKRHFAASAFTVKIKYHIQRQHWHTLQKYGVYPTEQHVGCCFLCVIAVAVKIH